MRRALQIVLVAALLAGCGSSPPPTHRSLTIAVNAPFSRTPYLGRAIENGARLAAGEERLAAKDRVPATELDQPLDEVE